jgi:DNA-binding CsgD family transcriptional regulator/tetratricopeptide (TPR) repeat protein
VATRVTSTRLIGRLAELTELESAVADATDGRPSLAFVAGESGVGKTRLVTELCRRAKERGVRVEAGDCVELGEDELPYAPLVAVLRSLAREGDPAIAELPAPARSELAALLPELGAPDEEGEPMRATESSQAQPRVFEALLWLIERLGRDAPLMLWLEDIHWADRSTRAFLSFLTRNLWSERVLVVATYRSDELHRRHPLRPLLAELERSANARRVELAPLTREELASLLEDILGAAPQEELVERLFVRSEGNPLFTEELLAAGLDGQGSMPASLRDALMVRIERLDQTTQDVLRVLALGRSLPHDALAEAADADPSELRVALREAAEAHIIVADQRGDYRFRHALLGEVVHDDLLPGERADMHHRLAEALQRRLDTHDGDAILAAEVAHHFLTSGDQPAAFKAALRAADAAERVHAYGEAAIQVERALDLWQRIPDPEEIAGCDRAGLLGRAGKARVNDSDYVRAETMLSKAIAAIDVEAQPYRAADLLHSLTRARWSLGRPADARETIEQAAALLPDGDQSVERARILAWNAKALMLEGRYGESQPVAREAIEVARRAGDSKSLGDALNALGTSLISNGDVEEGVSALREAIATASPGWSYFSGHVNLADALHLVGRSEEALAVALEAYEPASTESPSRAYEWLALTVVDIEWDLGRWPAARSHLPPDRTRVGTPHAYAELRLAEIALADGHHDDAELSLDRALPIVSGSREPQFIGWEGSLRAELERRRGDIPAARTVVDDALDAIEFCSEDRARIARLAHAGAQIEADAAERARDLGDEDAERLAISRAEGYVARIEACADDSRPVEQAQLVSAKAALLRARGEPDGAAHVAAAETWLAIKRPYPAAIERLLEAQVLTARGDRDAAAAALGAAREQALALGGHWLLAEIDGLALRARLTVAGSPPAETPAPAEIEDPFGLTPREQQVLALVASGCTNREIGQKLFMAEKTASVHVSRILAKLDVRSRTEAAAVAHRLGMAGVPQAD